MSFRFVISNGGRRRTHLVLSEVVWTANMRRLPTGFGTSALQRSRWKERHSTPCDVFFEWTWLLESAGHLPVIEAFWRSAQEHDDFWILNLDTCRWRSQFFRKTGRQEDINHATACFGICFRRSIAKKEDKRDTERDTYTHSQRPASPWF